MKRLTIPLAILVLGTWAVLAEGEKPAPTTLVFESKMGNVTFDHVKHLERAGNDCKNCHPTPFAQDRSPIGYKEGMHKKAEEAKTTCATCHHAGGKSFESKGNCNKCHIKA